MDNSNLKPHVKNYVAILAISFFWLFSCAILIFPCKVSAQDFRGVFSGDLKLSSKQIAPSSSARPSQRLYFKFALSKGGQDFYADIPFYSSGNFVEISNNQATFVYEDVYDYGDGCDGEISVTVTPLNRRTAFVSRTYMESCDDGAVQSSWTYSGNIKIFRLKDDINFTGQNASNTKSRCFTLTKPTTFDYEFSDTGGFYARFDLRLQTCSGRAVKQIANIKKYVSEYYKEGTFKVSPGKYRFSINSTDQWEVDARL